MSLRDPGSKLLSLTGLMILPVVLGVSGCDWIRECCADKSLDPEPSVVTAVRSDVEEVQVTPAPAGNGANPSRKLKLSAGYLDSVGNIVADAPPLQWSFDPSTEGSVTSGEVTVATFPDVNSKMGEVRVSGGGFADTVKLTRWANASAARSAGDVLKMVETGAGVAGRPSVALVEELSSGKCRWGPVRGFVGAAAVGEQAADPCSVSLFSTAHGMQFLDKTKWTPGQWATNGSSIAVTPVDPLKLKVTVFIAVSGNIPGSVPSVDQTVQTEAATSPPTAMKAAQMDVELATALYDSNRTGITIDVKYEMLPPSGEITAKVGADPYDCVLPVQLPADPSTPGSFWYDSSAVSVYYVDHINFPPDPKPPRVRGIHCHFWYSGNPKVGTRAAIGHPELGKPPGNGPVIYISYTHRSNGTLAHELGHALGLNDEPGRLGPTNIMHNLLPDLPLNNARSRFTIGQGFRMNLWNDSWINTRLPRPPQRACNEAQEPCPTVELDAH